MSTFAAIEKRIDALEEEFERVDSLATALMNRQGALESVIAYHAQVIASIETKAEPAPVTNAHGQTFSWTDSEHTFQILCRIKENVYRASQGARAAERLHGALRDLSSLIEIFERPDTPA